MTQAEYVLRLLSEVSEQAFWVTKTRDVLCALDVRAVYEAPGEMPVNHVLADAKIHLKTLAAAQCVAIGLNDLIQTLEGFDSNEGLVCYGFASDSLALIGSCYLTKNGNLVGCAWVPR